METPKITTEDDEMTFVWAEDDVAVHASMLRQERGGLTGEIRVSTVEKLPSTGRPGHRYWGSFNFAALGSRHALAKYLAAKEPSLNWADMLEYVAVKTMELWRWADRLVDLAEVSPNGTGGYLVNKLLPRGETTILYGDGGAGKSVFSLAVAAAVSGNLALPPPFTSTEIGNVYYLDWETSAQKQRQRLERLCRGAGVPMPAVHYREMRSPLTREITRVRQDVRDLDAKLVIVDSMAGAMEGTPSADEFTIPFFNALRTLNPTARLVITHMSWASAEKERGEGRPFGSIYTRNYARSAWEVRYTRAGQHLYMVLYHRKSNEDSLCPSVHLDLGFETASIMLRASTPGEDEDLDGYDTVANRLWRVMSEGGVWSIATLAEQTGDKPKTVAAVLNRGTVPGAVCLDKGAQGRGFTSRWCLDISSESPGASP